MVYLKQKIGIMGGTFDPIHIGHLVTAEAVRMEFGLDKVLFIPAGQPPHKDGLNVTPALHRYIMTVIAICSNHYFYVSPMEMEREGPSYTIDAIQALIKEYGDCAEFYFITGADAVQELHSWKDIQLLLDLCHFIAAPRPGSMDKLDEVIASFGEKGVQRIHRLSTPELEISSTDIREKVRQGQSIKYVVPEAVEKYIIKEGLYS